MKKAIFLFTTGILTLSCSSDDDSTPNYTNDNIVGSWKIIDYHDNYFNNIQEVEENDEPCFSLQTKDFNSNLTLDFNYKYGNSCQNSGTTNNTFSINGNILTEIEPNGGYEPNTDYVVKYYIEELNDNTLKLKGFYVDEGVSGENPENGEYFYETWQKIE
ncbi:lipocalin family protein [Flavobacterium haoranii]|uniref:Lipocalin-like domain-containing protein n=1 Tax=Flavobacterium haoranii TaxID=683124 RepID=A0A1M6H857_9FLAO|nr:lipocalin family protein [Flavobacterium haoranii]SHJ18418.1 Lipocalin-like domain-containing protein [Flavobacterium haoranii]